MTTVRMTQRITGYRDGIEWPEAGGTIEVPEGEASDLAAAGLGEIVELADPADVVETPEDGVVEDLQAKPKQGRKG